MTESGKVLMDADRMRRSIARIAHEVAENVESMEALALVGIHRRGVEIAQRLAVHLEEAYGSRPDTGAIDITFYRDDVDTRSGKPGYCLLYTSDAADDLLCVDLGGRRIIKKKKKLS